MEAKISDGHRTGRPAAARSSATGPKSASTSASVSSSSSGADSCSSRSAGGQHGGGPSQRQQQVGLDVGSEPRQHRRRRRPQLSGVEHQARVDAALDLEDAAHRRRPRRWAVRDPQARQGVAARARRDRVQPGLHRGDVGACPGRRTPRIRPWPAPRRCGRRCRPRHRGRWWPPRGVTRSGRAGPGRRGWRGRRAAGRRRAARRGPGRRRRADRCASSSAPVGSGGGQQAAPADEVEGEAGGDGERPHRGADLGAGGQLGQGADGIADGDQLGWHPPGPVGQDEGDGGAGIPVVDGAVGRPQRDRPGSADRSGDEGRLGVGPDVHPLDAIDGG